MINVLKKACRKLPVASVCVIIAFVLALPMSAQAKDGKRGHGKGKQHASASHKGHRHHGKSNHNKHKKNKGKPRMTICHAGSDGEYEQKSLPIHAAMTHLAKHDMDREPFVGDDGSETCILVEPPVEETTSCVMNVGGTDFTVSSYVASRENDAVNPIVLDRYNVSTGSGACRLFYDTSVEAVQLFNGQNDGIVDIFFGLNSMVVTEAQYADCARDIERVAQARNLGDASCPSYLGLEPENTNSVTFTVTTFVSSTSNTDAAQ